MAGLTAAEIARLLAARMSELAPELLPGGHREGREWRAGSIAGDAGSSLGVHLAGTRAGVWCDFATGEAGDALDLLRAAFGFDTGAAMAWSRRWLGIDDGAAELPRRAAPAKQPDPGPDPDRWRRVWQAACPIAGTLAETYLAGRGLHFGDRKGRVLRFAARSCRKSPDGDFEQHPALLAALSDARTGEQCGLINIYLAPDGRDRLRDKKAKTVRGRAAGAVVMLDAFDAPTMGLVLCEGVETGIAIHQSGLRPIWACGGAGTLATLPILGAIAALTIAADSDKTGQDAAEELAQRYRQAGREPAIIAPPAGDWADDE
jgi:hypothetical protein